MKNPTCGGPASGLRILFAVAMMAACGCGGGGGGGGGGAAEPASPSTFLASLNSGLIQANDWNFRGPVTNDGRSVFFASSSANLVTGDTNNASDVFVRDPEAGTTVRISVDSAGLQGNSGSHTPSMSADGRYVSFISHATNLVAGDTNALPDIYIRDLAAGTTTRASLTTGGFQPNHTCLYQSISADGRYVAFSSYASNYVSGDTNGLLDIFVHDTATQTTTRITGTYLGTQTNSSSDDPVISSDGRYVAFYSTGTDLVQGDTNGVGDIFLRDRVAGSTSRVSVSSSGSQANNGSFGTSISPDGRYVAFSSQASNLVAGDTNGLPDVFIRDTVAGTTTRVSVSSSASQGNGPSGYGSISADGGTVAFFSTSTNLGAGDSNGTGDIFIRDIAGGTTMRVSVSSAGAEANAECGYPTISPDGRRVAYVSASATLVTGDTNGLDDVFVTDVTEGTTIRASVGNSFVFGNDDSYFPSISSDGRYVAIESEATNLVAGDTNARRDIFIRDLVAGTTTRVSVSSAGAQANADSTNPAISPDGRYVAFTSSATNLVPVDTNACMDVFVRDLAAGTTTRASLTYTGDQSNDHSLYPSISAGGRYVAFVSYGIYLVAGDTNGYPDVFVRDLQTGTTVRASVSSAGAQGPYGASNPSISADGRHVAFESMSSSLVTGDTNGMQDIFVRDLLAGTTVLASAGSTGGLGNGSAFIPSISSDGRWVAFASSATNLVAGDLNGTDDVFVRDVVAGTTIRASVNSSGAQGNGFSSYPKISADGRYVVFTSLGTNFVLLDVNGGADAFVRDLVEGTTIQVSIDSEGAQGNDDSSSPAISGDGRFVAFSSFASNLVAEDTNGRADIFVRGPLR